MTSSTLSLLLSLTVALGAQSGQADRTAADDDTRAGRSHALIICGHPGDEDHRAMYAGAIEKLHKALTTRYGFAPERVRVLFGSETNQEDGPALQSAKTSTQENLKAETAELQEQVKAADRLWVIVMGHAHYDGRRSWLNLPDADLHQDEFGGLFGGIDCKEQVFFITTPVSGFYLRPLARKGRVVISATESDLEVNETIYPLVLADILAEPPEPEEFDVDEDEKLTLFDLYITVAREVADRYLQDELLATEHAQLDDNGDGRGTEVQIDYLTEEQGGRAGEDYEPPTIPAGADGALSVRTRLQLAD